MQLDASDKAGGRVLYHLLHNAFHALHTKIAAEVAQEQRVQAGIKMVSMRDLAEWRIRNIARTQEAIAFTGLPIEGIVFELRAQAEIPGFLPVVPEADVAVGAPEMAEGMHVSVTLAPPIDKFDAQFEGALCRFQHVVGINAKHLVEFDDRGNGGFADTNRADLLGFNQRNATILRADDFCQRRGRHPAGGTTANNDDVIDIVVLHHCNAVLLLILR